jgi:hypothetical protein
MLSKGIIKADHSYQYTCGNCNGTGWNSSSKGEHLICMHCYGLDYDQLIEAFRMARGKRYYGLLKAILHLKGKAICDRALEMQANHPEEKLLVHNLVELMIEFQFPVNRFKALVEWLEETRIVPPGLYEYLKDNGFKISGAIKALEKASE